MDETTQTRIADAAATRKRRSSILKSQRPARTPFSELEFHVATPTDTSKSRRVSFSKRTGVAEFATNEATTTWKNFYEEHNKSLESSGNDSIANASKQHLGHIGKRIFDQQFEEADSVDFMGSLNPGYNVNSSISNINFVQLTSIDCTDDIKLTAPQSNFELSALTNNHSKLFNNDITVPGMGEQSDRIDINFSAIQKIGEKDDLDEIQRDFQNQGNVICHGPFRDKQNLSEYIEIDLNSTHAVLRNDESDMSITDTIHSPKVQEVSKSVSIEKIVNKDWETDKENIAVNPYVTPKETDNFAINYESDKVLVFDGKRLSIQCETVPNKSMNRESITPVQIEPPKAAHRKTIVLNVNDDLPNFIHDSANATGYLSVADLKKHIELDSSVSITNSIVKTNQTEDQKSIPYDDGFDISLTQAVSSNIVEEKRRTIVFEDGTSNISVTQAVPTNIIDKTKKRQTILYNNDTGNISITQALPTNVMSNERRNTIVFDNKDCNISMTQAIPNIIISVKSPPKSCTSEDGSGNMSVTQAISSNIIIEENLQERRRTVVFESDANNISVTQAVPANLIYTNNPNTYIEPEPINKLSDNEINRRKTIVFEDNAGNLSITQAVSSNVISNLISQENKRKTIVFDDEEADISMTQAVPMNKLISFTNDEKNKVFNNTGKRNTIVFNNSEADMSVTKAIDQIISGFEHTSSKAMPKTGCTEKRHTIVFGDEDAEISITQSVNVNQIKETTLHTNVVKDTDSGDCADISMSEVDPPTQEEGKCIIFEDDVFLVEEKPTHKRANINEILDMSMDNDDKRNSQDSMMNNKTINDVVGKANETYIPAEDRSLSKPIPHNLSQIQDVILDKSLKQFYKTTKNEVLDHTANVSQVLVYQISQNAQIVQKEIEHEERKPSIDIKIDDLKENSRQDVKTAQLATKNNDDVVDLTIDDETCSSVTKIASKSDNKTIMTMGKPDSHSECPSEEVEVIKINSEQSLKANVTNVSLSVSPFRSKTLERKSILHGLLDMSTSSLEKKTTDQIKLESHIQEKHSVVSANKDDCMKDESNDSLFYITNDIDEEVDNKVPQIEKVQALPLEYKKESPVVNELQKKLALLKTVFGGKNHTKKKETQRKSTTHDDTRSDFEKSNSKYSKSFKHANDTNELLDMLSDLTDKQISRTVVSEVEEEEPEPLMINGRLALENKTEPEKDPKRISFVPETRSIALGHEEVMTDISMAEAALPKLEFDEFSVDKAKESPDNALNKLMSRIDSEVNTVPEPLTIKGRTILKNKTERVTDLKRISFVPERRSIALSNEDILKAAAALQKSGLGTDDFNYSIDNTKESPDINISANKAVRLSKEIVKTLQFDEDSVSEVSQESPLKKTAFGERSYMAKNKANVIPSFIKDVSDGLKELMDDLVKPMADNVPFDSSGTVDQINKPTPSTCSMQIQTNLITSSQVDINAELYSNSDSMNYFPKTSSAEIIEDAVQRSLAHSVQSFSKSETVMTPESESECIDEKVTPMPDKGITSPPGVVIVFDHNNPLNNIFLPPLERGDIHKYNPVQTHTICAMEQADSTPVTLHQSPEDKSTHNNYPKVKHMAESTASNVSKPTSIDQSENTENDIKDTEVNTIIAMKGNKELLEASSSLTLVDDTMLRKNPENKHSPIQLLYKLENQPEKDSDFTSTDEDLIQCQTKAKKRNYSPARVDKHKHCTLSNIDITPKPQSKMQKISERSFKEEKNEKPTKLKADKDENKTETKRISSPTKTITFSTKQFEPKRIQLKSPKQKKEQITVNQVLTDIRMNIDQETEQLTKKALLDISSSEPKTVSETEPNSDLDSVDMVSSCTSSKNLGRDDRSIVTSSGEHYLSDVCSKMEWQDNTEYNTNYVSDCDSSVNIVAKIDMLPFMGSHECEWESSIGDTWSFRLLHSCLRLSVRLQHRHENATRTCVRADTPVLHSQIEIMHTEKKNPITELCIRFACEAMRFELSHGCSKAGSVPALVRRCAATARLATRWARTMHDARARLAFSLTRDGILALKVANIPLRSVWEVRLKMDLVVTEAGSEPFPRAMPVAAVRVLADRHVHLNELRHLVKNLPHDWGHAPRTIWRIFNYLKNKKREDEFLELKY